MLPELTSNQPTPRATSPGAFVVSGTGPGRLRRGNDPAIIQLVAERARLSSRIQAARVSSGGTRVELGRERVILDAYRSTLGANGPHLADAILQVCRGNR